jgi:hypothetical protein
VWLHFSKSGLSTNRAAWQVLHSGAECSAASDSSLYFVRLPWLHNAKSGLLFGVSEDPAHLARIYQSQTVLGPGLEHNSQSRRWLMNFEGRVALITGGTAGIGEATVRRVASLGGRTVFVGRDENDGRHRSSGK